VIVRAIRCNPVALFVLLLAMGGCNGLTSPWNGNWKLNPYRSVVHGGFMTVASLPDSEIRQTNEVFNFDFHCDGKEYSNPNGKALTTSCDQLNPGKWKLTYRRNGTIRSEVFWDLSSDNSTLTMHGKSINTNGTSRAVVYVYDRRDAGKGFVGRWQLEDPFASRATLLKLSMLGNRLHLAYPEFGEYVDAPLDGTSTPWHASPWAREGFAMSAKLEGPLQMHTQNTYEGRVIREETLKLSDDGRTLTQVSWAPERPDEVNSFVYEKEKVSFLSN